MSKKIKSVRSKKIKCPYCGELYTDSEDDYFDCDGEIYFCESCGGEFLLEVETETYYTTRKKVKCSICNRDEFEDGSKEYVCYECELKQRGLIK